MPRMTGKRAMIEQLMADGVRHIFGNPGTTEQGFMDILQDYPQIEFMLALHEGVAVCMADAYARVTRRPAFVEVHIAPGLGNALGMLHNAAVGKTPLVVYAGPVAGRHPAAGAAPLRAARRHGAARSASGRRRSTTPTTCPAPCAAPSRWRWSRRRGRSSSRCRWTRWTRRPTSRSQPTTYTHWRGRVDPARHGRGRAPAPARRRAADADGRRQRRPGRRPAGGRRAGRDRRACRSSSATPRSSTCRASHPLYLGERQLRHARARCARRSRAATACSSSARRCSSSSSPRPTEPAAGAARRSIQIDINPWELGKNINPDLAVLADPKAALAELAEQMRRLRTPAAGPRRRGARREDRRAHQGRARALLGAGEEELGRRADQRAAPDARDPRTRSPTTRWCSPRPSRTRRT